MNQISPRSAFDRSTSLDNAPPDDSPHGAVRAGWLVLLVFFGGFGTWMAMAPLNAAVVGEAVIKVEGNRKSVQHLEGGIVREIRVKEGQKVNIGDVLIVLDDGANAAEHQILKQQHASLLAMRARLEAEIANAPAITFPPELMLNTADPSVNEALASQQAEFASRNTALAGETAIIERRVAQLEEQVKGSRVQAASFTRQLESIRAEEASLAPLLQKGYITQVRVLQLQRTAEGLRGQIEAADTVSAQALEEIAQHRTRIEQLQKDRIAEAVRLKGETEWKLADISPRLENAKARLGRTMVRSPYAGSIVAMNVFSTGGVIAPGERILDVVPGENELVVEARINVQDISDIRPGMKAEVHFTSYKQRTIPLIHGTVSDVSADRLTDERTQTPYYVAAVAVDEDELAKSPQIQLYPGMPVTVMITTQERTALDYLLGPLLQSFDKSFRQR
jgi:epimerase transport system membrane fusion protein